MKINYDIYMKFDFMVDPKFSIDKNYVFKRLSYDDLASCRLASERNRRKIFECRMQEHHEAYGWCFKGEVVFYLWLSRIELNNLCPFEAGTMIQLTNKQIYIWDCRTHAEHRRKNLFKSALVKVGTKVCSDREVLIAVRAENEFSKRAIQGAGFERKMQIKFISFFKKTLFVSMKQRLIPLLFRKNVMIEI